MKTCCGKEVIFNGSQEICFECLKIYQHSNQDVIDELERRLPSEERHLPEVLNDKTDNTPSLFTEKMV